MSQQVNKKDNQQIEPLISRHIFLDTQVFRALGHNPKNRAMKILKDQISSHRIVLHSTDITMLEIKRQIRERVLSRQREIAAAEKDLYRWRTAAPTVLNKPVELDAESLASALFQQFSIFVKMDCQAHLHHALKIDPSLIFEDYFNRTPPFDGEDSKEFPDGFVIKTLTQWCESSNNNLYIVTEDKAMLRAVEASQSLHSLKNIHELLTRSAADLGSIGEAAAEAALNAQDFDGSFKLTLTDAVQEIAFVYTGDLAEGEAYEGMLLSIEEVDGWSVVNLSEKYIDLIVSAKLVVQVEVQFEDREDAIYDKEDDRWFGAEFASTTIEDNISIEILVEVERGSGAIREFKLLTQEVYVNGE